MSVVQQQGRQEPAKKDVERVVEEEISQNAEFTLLERMDDHFHRTVSKDIHSNRSVYYFNRVDV